MGSAPAAIARVICSGMAKRSASSTKPKKPAREIEFKPPRAQPGLPVAAPFRLSQVIGQERAIAALRATIHSGRIHHAWVFHGPPGVGKFTAAVAFAAVLLDPTSQPDLSGLIEPQEGSDAQRLLHAGTHPDLHIITKELAAVSRDATVRESKQRNIAKAVLEEFLIEPATRTRGSAAEAAAGKVFIIDEAELIDPVGQNALLKTLEEPPPGSVIILVTSREERLLPTIRSRAQRIAFSPLSTEGMQRWLASSKTDLAGLDASGRNWLLSFADGSPGAARLALDTGLLAWHVALSPMLAELDRGRFPIDLGTVAAKLADEWAEARISKPESGNASKEAASRAAARQLLRLLAEHYREHLRSVVRESDRTVLERAARSIELIQGAERQIESNVQLQFVLESLGAQLAQA